MDEKQQKIIDEVKQDMDYNLKMLDSWLSIFSGVGICCLVLMCDKFCGSSLSLYFVLELGLFFVSLLCQLLSHKAAAVSANYDSLFWVESDQENKLKASRRFKTFHHIDVFLKDTALYSFILACIFLVVMLWVGL
ncbi:MAG: hypothetical protein LBJ96_02320 [Holosporaceae bacterium]|nr:hypothetical protein [Holosporaceae bacterium]